MDLPLEKIVALLLFLIVLVTILFFSELPKAFGTEISLQQKLRKCCQGYIAQGCPDFFPTLRCNGINLEDLVLEVGLVDMAGSADISRTKEFCNCP